MMIISLRQLKQHRQLLLTGWLCCLSCCLFSSCSKEESAADEYDNWQQRNEAFFATLDDSLDAAPDQWQRILSYSLSSTKSHDIGKYIYVKKLVSGEMDGSPAGTDSVCVIYQGRLSRRESV